MQHIVKELFHNSIKMVYYTIYIPHYIHTIIKKKSCFYLVFNYFKSFKDTLNWSNKKSDSKYFYNVTKYFHFMWKWNEDVIFKKFYFI